ncbi:MAG: hypothetical protein EP346_03050 [Bacteroidetes bacterium]|nr:MAG: hypothetical protein EP346_03050 [Bacteroidota bacterium]
MKIYGILLLFLSPALKAQHPYNQLDSNGFKIGEWHTINEHDQLVIEVYNPPTAYDLSNKRIAFDLGIANSPDSILYLESLNYRDIEQTNGIPNLHYYKREYYRWRATWVYGEDRKLERLDKQVFYLTVPIGDSVLFQSSFVSYSDSLISLRPKIPSNFRIVSGQTIAPKDTTVIVFKLGVLEGLQRQAATVLYGEVPIEFTFESFGYHITSEDFNSEEPLQINGTSLCYYRTAEESELFIYDETQTQVLLESSLAKEKSIHDLSSLEPGDYWLYIKNYTLKEFLWKRLEIMP